jgi:cysteine sulfinate desulfinase/cysteine desulfurase-like protein
MTDNRTGAANAEGSETGSRQRAIEAYDSARDRVSDTLSEAPLIALAGGLAAGALIAALLPRTDAETRVIRPTARRVKQSAQAAFQAAKDTGTQRLGDMGLSRDRAEETIRSLLGDVAEAAKASGQAALDASRKRD